MNYLEQIEILLKVYVISKDFPLLSKYTNAIALELVFYYRLTDFQSALGLGQIAMTEQGLGLR